MMMLTRSQLAVVVGAVLVALVAATTTRWTVRIVLGRTPDGFVFEREVRRQGSIFGVTTGGNGQLTNEQRQNLEDQFTALDPNGDLGVQFDSFEQEEGTDDFVLVLDAETNGTDPTNVFRNIRNVTIMFMNDTMTFDLNNNNMTNNNNDTDTPITVTPREGDGDDNVPVILGAIFGTLAGLLVIAFIVLYVKRAKEKQKTGATTSSTELETVRSVRVVSRSQARDAKDEKPQEEPKKKTPASEPVQTFEPEPAAKASDVTLEDTQHTAATTTDSNGSNTNSTRKRPGVAGDTPEPQQQQQPQAIEEPVPQQREPEEEPSQQQQQQQEPEEEPSQQQQQQKPEEEPSQQQQQQQQQEPEEPQSEQPEPQAQRQEPEAPHEEEEQAPEQEPGERKLSAPEPDDIAHRRASYRWNAGANAVADPQPGGEVVEPSMERVVDDLHKQQAS